MHLDYFYEYALLYMHGDVVSPNYQINHPQL